jgi:hypothetical protein
MDAFQQPAMQANPNQFGRFRQQGMNTMNPQPQQRFQQSRPQSLGNNFVPQPQQPVRQFRRFPQPAVGRRNWSRQPTSNEVDLQTVWKKMTNPDSPWCFATASTAVFVLTALVLVSMKPKVAQDEQTGRVCAKKTLFLALLAGAVTFGGSFYLSKRFRR